MKAQSPEGSVEAGRRSGREPVVARSALKVRLPLAVFGLLTCALGAAVAFVWDDPPFDIIVLGSACVLLAVVALIDIIVVLVRLRPAVPGDSDG